MLLSPQEAERFFRLHRTLMFFVNERLDIIAGVESPEAFAVLPAEERRKVRDALVERLDLIDAFVEANPTGFSDDELLIVRSWRNQLFGRFYIFRDLVKYTVFLRDKDGPVAFGVTALSQPFESLVGPYLPVMVETVLLPFQNKLVY
ncbi:MAG TPA: hypothetical protein VFI31_28280, partial [Pirellulales bacterium]|nr:hypothetical protein [Pirellulales bacterium]